jgi:hypothetical protein
MIAAIKRWILMICAILKTNIRTFHQVQLPMSDHTVTLISRKHTRLVSQDAFNKAFSSLTLPSEGPPPPGCSIYEAKQASN